MRFAINVCLALVLSLSSSVGLSYASASSFNIKLIPKAFTGQWVGLHSTKQKLNKKTLKDLCENGGEQDTSLFVTFNEDQHRLMGVTYWEDSYDEYPISYSKYTSNHIVGQSLTMAFQLGDDDELVIKKVGKFDFKITNGTLYMKTHISGDGNDVLELMRCP